MYPTLPKISVDHAIMKPAADDPEIDVCVLPMDVSWIDVGSWSAYAQTLPEPGETDAGCRANARTVHLDSRDIVVVSDDPDHLVVTIGCDDLVIVRTGAATLVCPRESAQRVREVVAKLDPRDR